MGCDDDHHRWRINVHAMSPKFSLKIKASATPPAASKPQNLAPKLKSGSAPPTHSPRGGFLRSMFRRFFKRVRPPSRLTQKEASSAAIYPTSVSRIRRLAHEEPVEVWTVFLAAFALGAVAAIALRGAIAGGALAFVPISLVLFSSQSLVLLKNYVTGRKKSDLRLILSNLLVMLIVLASEFWDLGKHLCFFRNHVLRYISGRL